MLIMDYDSLYEDGFSYSLVLVPAGGRIVGAIPTTENIFIYFFEIYYIFNYIIYIKSIKKDFNDL